MLKKLTIIIATFVCCACAAKKTTLSAKKNTADEKEVVAEQLSLDTLTTEILEGKLLYTQNCGSCHGLKKPESEPESEWRRIVPRMVKKVNASSQKLSPDDEKLILNYVLHMSVKK